MWKKKLPLFFVLTGIFGFYLTVIHQSTNYTLRKFHKLGLDSGFELTRAMAFFSDRIVISSLLIYGLSLALLWVVLRTSPRSEKILKTSTEKPPAAKGKSKKSADCIGDTEPSSAAQSIPVHEHFSSAASALEALDQTIGDEKPFSLLPVDAISQKELSIPVMAAVNEGSFSLVEQLLSLNAEVDAADEGGVTALMNATYMENIAMVRLLLQHGADPKRKDHAGYDCIDRAQARRNEGLLSMFQPWPQPLMERPETAEASSAPEPESVSQSARRETINVRKTQSKSQSQPAASATDQFAEVAEVWLKAISLDDPAMIKRWIGLGIDLNQINKQGKTPLIEAVECGADGAISQLVSAGADINAPDLHGDTPLHRAIYIGRIPTLSKLIHLGADLHKENGNKQDALMFAASLGDTGLVGFLLSQGSSIDRVNSEGYSPLTYCAVHRHRTIMRLLARKGANLDAGDGHGLTALDYALHAQDADLVKNLLNCRLDVARQQESQTTMDDSKEPVGQGEINLRHIARHYHPDKFYHIDKASQALASDVFTMLSRSVKNKR